MNRTVCSLALAMLAITKMGAAQEAPGPALSFQERRVAILPETLKVGEDPFYFSLDLNTLVHRGERGGMEFWIVGSAKGEEFEKLDGFTFSPDGKTMAYVAEKGGKSYVVIGGKKSEPFDKILCQPWFSPDGKTVTFRAGNAGKAFVIVGDRKIPVGNPAPDSAPPVFSPDGKTVAYVDSNGAKFFVVVGDKKGEEFDSVDDYSLTFTPDGKSVVYAAGNNQMKFVVVGGKKGDAFDLVHSLFITSDDNKVAYVARKNGKEFVVLGTEGGEEFERIMHLTLGSDGKTVVYWAFVDQHSFVVLGEKKGNKSPFLLGIPAGGISISPDCKTYAYITMTAQETACLVVGTEKGKTFDVGNQREFNPPIFSPDGKTIAYIYGDPKSEQTCLVVAGKVVGKYDRLLSEIMFSPDSRKLGVLALQGREIWWKVIEVKP